MPYGRGGAGNFEAAAAAKQAAQDRAVNDVESQRSTTDDISDSIAETKAPAQYAHSGRGGAGNYYSPQELSQTGKFDDSATDAQQTDDSSSIASKIKTKVQATLPAYRGRGGAGNYETSAVDNAELARSKAAKDEKEQERIRSIVAQDVETGLARPEKAKLPNVALSTEELVTEGGMTATS
ncbi:hypothetical protein B9Z65_5023 [Elsinoe australis]|uniref:Uncharacterized protein n=1 Tax=Elsinoe australis TaxID=40998 RepID=A0A2P7ZCV1_9PEZI|nr:hypothetical protein B9Z65_5023 [Elsinoe australis]